MKRFFILSISVFSFVFAGAQIKTAADVKNTFSPKNSMSNRIEFPVETALNQYNLDLMNFKGYAKAISYDNSGKSGCECVFNESNQLMQIMSDGKNICSFWYNTNSQLEIMQFGKQIVAKTYDKKGNVVSEALLFPAKSNASTNVKSKKIETTMSGNYIYTNIWQYQADTTEKIYLYEVFDNGLTQAWAIDRLIVYKYNGKGLLVKKVETAKDKTREALYEYKYRKGVLQQQIKTYSNVNMVESSRFMYEEGKLITVDKGYFKHISKRKSELLSSEVNMMKYDSVGNIVEYISNDGHRYDFCTMMYDENKRIVKVEKRREDGTMSPMFECQYNEMDYISESERNEVKTQFQYEYDINGNWTKQTIIKNAGTPSVISREIEYR
ncbi:MAG: hypothetical protein MJ198_03685 [Bacteroidales bacterium]|nr:hypothetical protein [Bacteroidales bacterium]